MMNTFHFMLPRLWRSIDPDQAVPNEGIAAPLRLTAPRPLSSARADPHSSATTADRGRDRGTLMARSRKVLTDLPSFILHD